jgi:hypothetical protein
MNWRIWASFSFDALFCVLFVSLFISLFSPYKLSAEMDDLLRGYILGYSVGMFSTRLWFIERLKIDLPILCKKVADRVLDMVMDKIK